MLPSFSRSRDHPPTNSLSQTPTQRVNYLGPRARLVEMHCRTRLNDIYKTTTRRVSYLVVSWLGCLQGYPTRFTRPTTDPVSNQAYTSGHVSFRPWCYELSHNSGQFLICTVTSLTVGQGLRHSLTYLIDGLGTHALGSIGSPTTPVIHQNWLTTWRSFALVVARPYHLRAWCYLQMHNTHWNTWCMRGQPFARHLFGS
jgi:hypothetical protein